MKIGRTLNLFVSVRDNTVDKNYHLLNDKLYLNVWMLISSSTLNPVFNSLNSIS